MSENRGTNSYFGVVLGGLVAVAAIVFILGGGELGGEKKVQGDQDLPPVAETTPSRTK
ncbi:MAG: hypothetical protein M5U07_04895 [Xanthobacteraceae bacterium]|nr:hypothetical protein [Xanthobacteraceae bacterium]